MRGMITGLIFGLFCLGAGAASAEPPQPAVSPDDFAQALKDAPCDDGQVRDDGGVCQPDVKTRGFNLGVRGRAPHPGATAKGAPKAAHASVLDDLRITFQSGSAQMTPNGEAEARNFATALQMPWLASRRFEIAGHTDASGSRKTNMALSQARADAVVDFLVAQGVDRSRLEAKGYGSERLALPNAPRDPANRRVEARSLN